MAQNKHPTFLWLSGPGSAISLVAYMFEQHISNLDWWPGLPWKSMALWSGLFFSGVLAQDCYNPNSWLRTRLRDYFLGVSIKAFIDNSATGAASWFVPTLIVNYMKPCRRGWINIRVYPEPGKGTDFESHKLNVLNVSRGDEKRIQLAFIRDPKPNDGGRHSLWGAKPGKSTLHPEWDKTVISGMRYRVEFQYKRKWRPAYKKVFYLQSHEPMRATIIPLDEL